MAAVSGQGSMMMETSPGHTSVRTDQEYANNEEDRSYGATENKDNIQVFVRIRPMRIQNQCKKNKFFLFFKFS